jgi:Zn-dependent protease
MAFLDWRQLLLALPGVLVAMTFHEYAHGLVAFRLGDPTAYRAGRLSPEPWAHIDWFGLAALLLIGFGWAKPVPIDPRYFRRPQRDMMLVALAGPAANFVMAFMGAVAVTYWQVHAGVPTSPGIGYYVFRILEYATVLNVAFGVFNLIPVPPLDGSRVVAGILPPSWLRRYYSLERFGLLILIVLLFTPFLTDVLDPARQWVLATLLRGAGALWGAP